MATDTQVIDLTKYKGMRFELSSSMVESVLSKENPVTLINEIQSFPNSPYLELFKEQNIHAIVIAGLYLRNELIGVLISAFIGNPIHLPGDAPALLKGLADQAAISITNASLFEQVRSGREHQKALSTRLVEIQETERRHIARELHDQVGQVLTGLQFMLESSKNEAGEAHASNIVEAQEIVSGLIEQIREMSLNLRPAMLDDIGLLPTLLWHFERYTKQTGIKISFSHNEITQRLSPDIETAVYRIVQEALTNIARYAQVPEAFIQLTLQENILGVDIIDHGLGFDANVEAAKWSTAGLVGMRERANMLGGYLVVKSDPNQGTQILVTIPLNHKPVERRNHVRNDISG
jgi:signal transduction histidine kinase